MLDDDISDSVFGTKSGKPTGRKFYWDGPIEVELPNKVERSLINIDIDQSMINDCLPVYFQYFPVIYEFLKMKNCDIKERSMGRN